MDEQIRQEAQNAVEKTLSFSAGDRPQAVEGSEESLNAQQQRERLQPQQAGEQPQDNEEHGGAPKTKQPEGEQPQLAQRDDNQPEEQPESEQPQLALSGDNQLEKRPEDEQPQPAQSNDNQPKQPTRAEIDVSFTEVARNREEYITYAHDSFALDDVAPIHTFAARRIGLSHIRKQTACQDACAYRRISHGIVLLDADGISACKFGEVGSELACNVAGKEIERLSQDIQDEKEFIHALLGKDFYRNMREAWAKRVGEHFERQGGKLGDQYLFEYGTTLLIAVITDNWIAALNLGDGQIFLYNESECQCLRLTEKEGPAPKSIIYGTYLEDVQRGLWPRSLYRGVLLTTDGVNDLLDKIPSCDGYRSCHNYILQIESRFMEKGEPYQPFVYSGIVLGDRRTIDLSRQRGATDDCSIVLAVDTGYKPQGEDIPDLLRKRFGQDAIVYLLRRIGKRANYLVVVEGESHLVYQTSVREELALRDPRLEELAIGTARMWRCEARWFIGDLCFSDYVFPDGAMGEQLEAEFQCGAFNTVQQYHKFEDPKTGQVRRIVEPLLGERVLRIYDALKALESHLAAQNLYLTEGAAAWIMVLNDENNTLLLPREAISEQPPSQDLPWSMTLDGLFPGLIGRLVCGEHSIPLFAPGCDILDGYYYLFNAERDHEEKGRFFRILYNAAQGIYGLKNCGGNPWLVTRIDGKTHEVALGKVLTLRDGDQIDVMKNGAKSFSCTTVMR